MRECCLALASASFGKACDHLTECEQALVDVNRLFLGESSCPSLARSLATCQIDKLELGDHLIINRGVVCDFESQSENTMRPTGCMVQVMGCYDFVFDAFIVVLHAMLGIGALENVEVLNRELVTLIPPNPEPFLVRLLELLR